VDAWKLILTIAGAITLVTGGLAGFVFALRIKSDDSWRQIAERRSARITDLEKENERLETKCLHLDTQNEILTTREARERAKCEWYENRYGSIPTDGSISRG
jgi:hypothetical protein